MIILPLFPLMVNNTLKQHTLKYLPAIIHLMHTGIWNIKLFQKLTANAARRSFPKISVQIMSICSAPSPHSPLQYKFHSLQPFVTVKIKGDSYNFHKVNICSCQLHLLCKLVPKEISSHFQSFPVSEITIYVWCKSRENKFSFQLTQGFIWQRFNLLSVFPGM